VISHRRAWLFAFLLVTALAAPFTVAAGGGSSSGLSVEVLVGFSCISGSGPARTDVTITLRSPQLHVRGRVVSRSNRNGVWNACFPLFDPVILVNGGDVLTVRMGDRKRVIEVPRLEPRIDRVHDVIEGRAQPNTRIDISISHRLDLQRSKLFVFSTMSNAVGRYRVDTTNRMDLIGWDEVNILAEHGRDLFAVETVTPALQVGAVSNDVVGYVNPGRNLTLEIKNRFGVSRGKVTGGPYLGGAFEIAMFKTNGSALYPLGHDTVIASLASDAVMEIPTSGLHAWASNDVVRGRCPPNAPFQLLARNRLFFGKADENGRLQRDVSARTDLRRGDEITLWCQYPTGDIWQDSKIAL
jgi:hypothetical protein